MEKIVEISPSYKRVPIRNASEREEIYKAIKNLTPVFSEVTQEKQEKHYDVNGKIYSIVYKLDNPIRLFVDQIV